ncbi:unnamed protein product [Bursaphelenchus okinawaensis]|uniref:Evolutionarily conserved signaling intermediate in Toll pathway, mitochondrial n=1 Tax=Bursaphelenchus okinawaensis TaxID=465554 RepID=A0A811KT31_9BILA|nr:unnamed protein product [Bursaphelenchus okinawaensis]CAG9110679.1 unnamed protein product [Bursaphelenchus okinawaensis]
MVFISAGLVCRRWVSTTSSSQQHSTHYDPDKRNDNPSLAHIDEKFESIPKENRNKSTFMAAIEMFNKRSGGDRGHVEFVTSALKHMKDYNLHKDLEVYKALLRVFPPGKFASTNIWHRTFMHYPNHQECAVNVLDEMEWYHVYPDKEVDDIVSASFGPWTTVGKKVKRQLYWLPKLRYTNKYLDVRKVENKDLSFLELAKLALDMISRDPGKEITISKMQDDTLIASAQSPLQKELIEDLPRESTCFYVDGPFHHHVRDNFCQYIVLSTDPIGSAERLVDKFAEHYDLENIDETRLYKGVLDEFYDEPDEPTIHEQTDQTILALGMIEYIDQNTASAWVNHLQETNPALREATVILRIRDFSKGRKDGERVHTDESHYGMKGQGNAGDNVKDSGNEGGMKEEFDEEVGMRRPGNNKEKETSSDDMKQECRSPDEQEKEDKSHQNVDKSSRDKVNEEGSGKTQ